MRIVSHVQGNLDTDVCRSLTGRYFSSTLPATCYSPLAAYNDRSGGHYERGKPAGIYVSLQEGEDLPFEFRKELMLAAVTKVKKSLQEYGLTEQDILSDFETTRQARR